MLFGYFFYYGKTQARAFDTDGCFVALKQPKNLFRIGIFKPLAIVAYGKNVEAFRVFVFDRNPGN
jgi:hypothetical protein